jgi:hypothetical protein
MSQGIHHRVAVFVLVLAVASTFIPGVLAQASTPTPIYDGARTPDQDGWIGNRTNSSIDNVANMATRVSTYFIGGSGGASAMLTGLLVGLAFVGHLGPTRGGIAVGAITAVMGAAIFAEVGLAETWVYPIVLMIIGLVLAKVYFRLNR